jgi:hypothetical protein
MKNIKSYFSNLLNKEIVKAFNVFHFNSTSKGLQFSCVFFLILKAKSLAFQIRKKAKNYVEKGKCKRKKTNNMHNSLFSSSMPSSLLGFRFKKHKENLKIKSWSMSYDLRKKKHKFINNLCFFFKVRKISKDLFVY